MPRPPAASSDTFVDAAVCARSGSTIERHFSAAQLPRLSEAGARAGSEIDVSFEFSQFDGQPAVAGALTGSVVLMCQRCLKAVPIVVDERFQVVIVTEDRADEPGGYEPVVGDASRFDLLWLTEDQALLALPLVPMHGPGECEEAEAPAPDSNVGTESQKPFQNLRDMLRQR
jgi:uncharacterized protein